MSRNLAPAKAQRYIFKRVTVVALVIATMGPALAGQQGERVPPVEQLPRGWEIAPILEPTILPAAPEDPSAPPFEIVDPPPVAAGRTACCR